MKKNSILKICILIFLYLSLQNLSADSSNDIFLFEKASEAGIVLYWDTLTSGGILEKNGHQLTFKSGEHLVMLDSDSFAITDPPSIEEGRIKVSKDFMNIAENLFKIQSDAASFKVGAVLLDPGHGGKDPGAGMSFNINGKKIVVTEKDITLSVGKMLYKRLKQSYPEKQIIMTRDTDVFLSLSERTDIANSVKLKENEAVLYISIHVNASLDKKASGYEVWYLSPGYRRIVIDKEKADNDKSLFPIINSMMEEEYTTESILIAKFIMDGLQSQIGDIARARGIRAAEWFVVRNTNMPSVLIELGFVTNQKEAENLSKESYLQKAALGIYNGITAFIVHFERSRGFTSTK